MEQVIVLECILQLRITHIKRLVAEINEEMEKLIEYADLFKSEVPDLRKEKLTRKLFEESRIGVFTGGVSNE